MPSCMGTTSLHSVNSATYHIRLIRVYLEMLDKQLHALPAILLSSHVKCCLSNL